MKFEDVNEERNDDDFIKKSLETLVNKAPVAKPMSQQMSFNEALSKAASNNSNYYKITGLPSDGLLYPKGTEICGRPLKVTEIKKLSAIGEGNSEFIIQDILKKTIIGIEIDNIYMADRLFLLLWLRYNSFKDSNFKVDFECTKCESDSTFHFNVNEDIEVQQLSPDYSPDKIIELCISKKRIKLKYLTIGEHNKLTNFKEKNKKSLMGFDDELLGLAEMITEVDGDELSLIEKYNFVERLDSQDYVMLTNYIDKYGMGIKPYMNVTCDKCGGKSLMAVTFHRSFMLPTYNFK